MADAAEHQTTGIAEKVGVVVEVFAQGGYIACHTDRDNRDKWYPFSVFYTKYAGTDLQQMQDVWMNEQFADDANGTDAPADPTAGGSVQRPTGRNFYDMTEILCVNDEVSFTVRYSSTNRSAATFQQNGFANQEPLNPHNNAWEIGRMFSPSDDYEQNDPNREGDPIAENERAVAQSVQEEAVQAERERYKRYLATMHNRNNGSGLAASSAAPTVRARVIDVVLLNDPMLSEPLTSRFKNAIIEEDMGCIASLTDDGGNVKTERWGNIQFFTRSLVLMPECIIRNTEDTQLSARRLINVGRTVFIRLRAESPGKPWIAISVMPYGKVYEGEGVITEIRGRAAFIASRGFGHIFLPYEALYLKREYLKNKINYWPTLVGYTVQFKITQSLPQMRFRWRAIRASLI